MRPPVINLLVALLGAPWATGAFAADPAPTPIDEKEKQKIEQLISAVQSLKDAKFVRNGSEYDGKAAADHMRRKWKVVEKDVKSARDFIRLAGTKAQSGKPYLIRFKDGKELESATFLTRELESLEKRKALR